MRSMGIRLRVVELLPLNQAHQGHIAIYFVQHKAYVIIASCCQEGTKNIAQALCKPLYRHAHKNYVPHI